MLISDVFERKKRHLRNLEKARKKVNEKKNNHLTAYERIAALCDEGRFRETDKELTSKNPINFPDYDKKREELTKKCHMNDAIVTGFGRIDHKKVAIGVFDTRFFMGSMGTVVGERIVRLVERAKKDELPLIIFSASGGARMQEGLFSLMQMAKTAAAVRHFQEKGGLFISCLTNPTTGGVSASFASLGDIIIAEPKALICFAGPRVIRQTIGQELPEGFQRAEFLLEHGMIDAIVDKSDMRDVIIKIIRMHEA